VLSPIPTLCSSLQQVLRLLSRLCLHQWPVLPCSPSRLTSYSSHCRLVTQLCSWAPIVLIPMMTAISHRSPALLRWPISRGSLVKLKLLYVQRSWWPDFCFLSDSCEFLDMGTLSDERLVCNLLVQLLLGLARAASLGSKFSRTQTLFYCLIWDSPSLEGQVSVFISARNIMARLHFRALGSLFVASYDSQGYVEGINPPPHGQSRSQTHITTDSQSVGPSWCQAPICDPRRIFLSPWNFSVEASLTRG
jgi:hypothetical protein